MLINELKKSQWLNKKSKRLGRWNASWKGNYSTKGQKWQWSRSGGGMPAWFEGWQTPLTQRLPKLKGFKRHFKLVDEYQVVNLWNLEADERISSWATVDKALLKSLRYITKEDGLVKVLSKWDISKKLTFAWIDAFSSSAKEKIEKTGWSIN